MLLTPSQSSEGKYDKRQMTIWYLVRTLRGSSSARVQLFTKIQNKINWSV